MGDNSSYFQCIPLAVFNTASMTGSYQSLNGTGFGNNIKILKIYNGGSQGVTISYDGVNDHDFFPPFSTFILDLQTNHHNQGDGSSGILNGRMGQKIYGKGTAGTGNFYISGYR